MICQSELVAIWNFDYQDRNMDAEMFNLTWDAFQQSAKETFKSLVHEQEFMDVTLACDDDKQIKAHKVILSACSPFLKNILVKNPHSSPLLFLSGVKFRDLKAILNFMYLGETNVEQCHLESFMAACNILRVRGLTEPDLEEPEMNKFPTEKEKVFQSKTSLNSTTSLPVKTEKFTNVNDEQSTVVANFDQSEDVPSFHNPSSLEAEFTCNKCDFQTSQKFNLKRHDEMKHQGIKYPCDGCDYKASSKDNLKRHGLRKHTGQLLTARNVHLNLLPKEA